MRVSQHILQFSEFICFHNSQVFGIIKNNTQDNLLNIIQDAAKCLSQLKS